MKDRVYSDIEQETGDHINLSRIALYNMEVTSQSFYENKTQNP